MSAPDFSKTVVDLLMFRSSLICNNPSCGTLTVGPSDATGPLALKLGEAAHIRAAREKQPRYDASMTNKERADFSNGIWLCANCHTMVDKNQGADFSADALEKWKSNHKSEIRSLLHSHRSPLPMLRRLAEAGRIAQQVIDLLEQHGAFFVELEYEVAPYMAISVETLRKSLQPIIRQIEYDPELKGIIKDIEAKCRGFMNHTSNHPHIERDELLNLRNHVGIAVRRLQQDYGCKIRGPLTNIL